MNKHDISVRAGKKILKLRNLWRCNLKVGLPLESFVTMDTAMCNQSMSCAFWKHANIMDKIMM